MKIHQLILIAVGWGIFLAQAIFVSLSPNASWSSQAISWAAVVALGIILIVRARHYNQRPETVAKPTTGALVIVISATLALLAAAIYVQVQPTIPGKSAVMFWMYFAVSIFVLAFKVRQYRRQ
jgi:hypothetical protein